MYRNSYPRNPDNSEMLEGEDRLQEASKQDLESIFKALGIEEDFDSFLSEEDAEVNLWVKLDQAYSSDYSLRVQSNEPVEGVMEIQISYGDEKQTYLGRVEMGAQDIFSLNYLSSYSEEEKLIEENLNEIKEVEAD